MSSYSKFFEQVWKLTKKIPNGKVSTYKEISRALKKPNAMKAVGNALSSNPFWPSVPCHRVVKSSGEVGGFSRGQKTKISLLKKEGINIKNGKVVDLKRYLFKF